MARLPLLDAGTQPELAGSVERIKAERGGKLLNLFGVLLNSEPIALGWLTLFTAIRQKAALDPALRELAILRVAVLNGAAYQRAAHRAPALAAGVSEAKLVAIADWRTAQVFDPLEQAVLAYADAMTTTIKVDSATFGAVRSRLRDRELLELTATIAGYNATSRLLVALEVDPEP